MAYIRYKGSPDVFDEATGRYISEIEAQKVPDFNTQIKELGVIRPDINTEEDFKKLSGTNIAMNPAPTSGFVEAPGTSGQTPQQPQQVQQPQGQQNPQQQGQNQQQPATQTNAVIQSTPDATVAQDGQQPLQQGGRFGTQQFGRVGTDVFEIMSDGSRRKVTAAEFNQKLKAQGLNLDVLPQLDLNDNVADTPAGPPEYSLDDPQKGPSGFMDDYQAIVKELGLSDIKSEFQKLKKEYEDLLNEKNEEMVEVNNDPWLSAGVRNAKLKRINDRYEGREKILTTQQELYQSLYEEGLAEAKFLTSGIQEDRNKMLDLAVKREEAQAKLEQMQFENELAKAGLTIDQKRLALDQYKAMKDGEDDESDKLLSVSEAKELGVPYGTTRGDAFGVTPNFQPTVEQSKARQFAVAANDANNILAQLNYNPGAVEPRLPNALKSQERQQFEQAARAFVNATLRRESGATITDDEFKNKYKELIPQAGDSDKVKTQKASARAAAVKSIQEAGGASGTTRLIGPDGKQYDVPDNKVDSFLKDGGKRPFNSGTTSSSSVSAGNRGIVAGYDIKSYATDPNHEKRIASIYSRLNGVGSTVSSIESYIKKVAPNSPIQGSDVLVAAKKYGVDPKMIVAIMEQDSSLGTKGKAVRTRNPGNVGNDDTGRTVTFPSWSSGVEAVARNLSKRKIG